MTIVGCRTRRMLALGLLWTLMLSGSAAIPLRPAVAGSFLWGVNGHPLVSYPGISDEAQIGLVADLGLGAYRVDVTDISEIDRLSKLVAIAKARGVQVLPVLLPAVDLKTMAPEQLYRISYDFAQTVVKRLDVDIRVWELGNEIENFAIIQPCEIRDDGTRYPCEWGPAGGVGAGEYVGSRFEKVTAVLRGLSDAVHALAPTARRAVGTAGWGHIGAFERYRDSGVDWDISVWHTYGQDPEWGFKALAKFGKPIWVTEMNHPLGSAKDGEDGQARGLENQMVLIRKLAPRYDVEAAFIYELLDETYWAPNFEAYMGLVQLKKDEGGAWVTGDHKVAYQTVRRVIALGAN